MNDDTTGHAGLGPDRGQGRATGGPVGHAVRGGQPSRCPRRQRITDKSQLFIRNICDLATAHTLEPQPVNGWEIELGGLIHPVPA